MSILGENLEKIRVNLGVSKKELSKVIDIDLKIYEKILNGTHCLEPKEAYDIALKLNYSDMLLVQYALQDILNKENLNYTATLTPYIPNHLKTFYTDKSKKQLDGFNKHIKNKKLESDNT